MRQPRDIVEEAMRAIHEFQRANRGEVGPGRSPEDQAKINRLMDHLRLQTRAEFIRGTLHYYEPTPHDAECWERKSAELAHELAEIEETLANWDGIPLAKQERAELEALCEANAGRGRQRL